MAELSGVEGAILADGQALEGVEFSIDRDCAVIDRSNWTTNGEPLNAAGQKTGSISASGPVSTTSDLQGKGVIEGALVTFVGVCRANANYVSVRGRISKITINNNKDNGPGWSLQAARYGAATVVGV
jgi:hypothetical protein